MENSTRHHLPPEVKHRVSVPTIVFVVTVMCLGILGNGLILMVYGRRIQKHSNYKSFVIMLAGIDMASCCVGMPGILVDMLRAYTFYSNTACKLLRFITHGIFIASALTHLLIGIERHRKICCPLKRQLSARGARVIIMAIILLSFVVALPAFMIFGKCKFTVKVSNITLSICTVTDTYAQSPFPTVYESILFSTLVSTILALLVLYVLMARRIWRAKRAIQPLHKRFGTITSIAQLSSSVTGQFSDFKSSIHSRLVGVLYAKSRLQSTNSTCASGETSAGKTDKYTQEQDTAAHTEDKQDTVESKTHSEQKNVHTKSANSINDADNEVSDVFHSRVSESNDKTETASKRTQTKRACKVQTKTCKMHSGKVTTVSFAITFVFIISYVPHFIIVIGTSVNGIRNVQMTATEEAFYRIGSLSYIINNAANFFVYYIIDNDFRAKFRAIICRCCTK